MMGPKLSLKVRMCSCQIEVLLCNSAFTSMGYCKKGVCCNELIYIVQSSVVLAYCGLWEKVN